MHPTTQGNRWSLYGSGITLTTKCVMVRHVGLFTVFDKTVPKFLVKGGGDHHGMPYGHVRAYIHRIQSYVSIIAITISSSLFEVLVFSFIVIPHASAHSLKPCNHSLAFMRSHRYPVSLSPSLPPSLPLPLPLSLSLSLSGLSLLSTCLSALVAPLERCLICDLVSL